MTTLPFLVFMVPLFRLILTHTDPTGYNQQGACVAFALEPPSLKEKTAFGKKKQTLFSWFHRSSPQADPAKDSSTKTQSVDPISKVEEGIANTSGSLVTAVPAPRAAEELTSAIATANDAVTDAMSKLESSSNHTVKDMARRFQDMADNMAGSPDKALKSQLASVSAGLGSRGKLDSGLGWKDRLLSSCSLPSKSSDLGQQEQGAESPPMEEAMPAQRVSRTSATSPTRESQAFDKAELEAPSTESTQEVPTAAASSSPALIVSPEVPIAAASSGIALTVSPEVPIAEASSGFALTVSPEVPIASCSSSLASTVPEVAQQDPLPVAASRAQVTFSDLVSEERSPGGSSEIVQIRQPLLLEAQMQPPRPPPPPLRPMTIALSEKTPADCTNVPGCLRVAGHLLRIGEDAIGMKLMVGNFGERPLSSEGWELWINRNPFGIAPSSRLQLSQELLPGGEPAQASLRLQCNEESHVLDASPKLPLMLQVAIKSPDEKTFFFEVGYDLSIVLEASEPVAKDEFRETWQRAVDAQKIRARAELRQPVTLEMLCERVKSYYIYRVTQAVRANGDEVVYFSARTTNQLVVLCAIGLDKAGIEVQVACFSAVPALLPIFQAYLGEVLSLTWKPAAVRGEETREQPMS
eukprot:TRINITY_DN17331_c0_g1_i1.p1 TRINITY_DN17331_c0_g1~~TRINITY_DN17331_c0_g1_i1.p1  ORF type:complete len:731 (-),score=143.89 TRINITY_DN17331_c0_g1_i1:420-2333(-)